MTLTSMVSAPCPAVPPGPAPQVQRCAGGPHLLFLPRWSNRAPLRGTSPRSLPAAHPLPQRPAPVPGRAVAGLHYAGAAGNHPQRLQSHVHRAEELQLQTAFPRAIPSFLHQAGDLTHNKGTGKRHPCLEGMFLQRTANWSTCGFRRPVHCTCRPHHQWASRSSFVP